jgi:hypothetical protein
MPQLRGNEPILGLNRLDNSKEFRTLVEIIFNMEKCAVKGDGKGKTPMRKDSLRVPTFGLSILFYSRKGTLFTATLWRYGVV